MVSCNLIPPYSEIEISNTDNYYRYYCIIFINCIQGFFLKKYFFVLIFSFISKAYKYIIFFAYIIEQFSPNGISFYHDKFVSNFCNKKTP